MAGDACLALALAAVLGLGWTLRAWSDLGLLRLPDGDDVMRLQQVRDWLDGQGWGDVGQHRLGTGLPMHWSRLGDLGPAGLIAAGAPWIGRHAAEVTAVIVYPLALFAAALFLIVRIARHLAGAPAARVAAVVAAIAYPATTVFLPGRIDHHGLQVVLLLGGVLALAGDARLGRGLAAGLVGAASLVVGLETALPLAALAAGALADWAVERPGASRQLAGYGGAALAGLAAGRWLFAGTGWDYPACDGFTGQAWRAAAILALAPLVLDALPVAGRRARIAAVVVVVGTGAAAALLISPGCLHPYGAVDPLLARLWLAHVAEAQPLFAASPADAIGYSGVMVTGVLATSWCLYRTPRRGWALLLAVQAAALVTTLFQLRGAYVGAILGAPGLAMVIGHARARGTLPLAAAWAASAGMLYPIAAQAIPQPRRPDAHGVACDAPALLARLAALPPGMTLAPIDAGPLLLASTRLRVVAAPYHRNATGNLASYRFFLGRADRGRPLAASWGVRYVVNCRSGLPEPAGSMIAALSAGTPPAWLRRIAPGVFVVAR